MVIESIEQLKKLASKTTTNAFVALNFGARSSKTINYDENLKIFHIHNEIDDTFESIAEEEIKGHFIGEATENGCLYLYD